MVLILGVFWMQPPPPPTRVAPLRLALSPPKGIWPTSTWGGGGARQGFDMASSGCQGSHSHGPSLPDMIGTEALECPVSRSAGPKTAPGPAQASGRYRNAFMCGPNEGRGGGLAHMLSPWFVVSAVVCAWCSRPWRWGAYAHKGWAQLPMMLLGLWAEPFPCHAP